MQHLQFVDFARKASKKKETFEVQKVRRFGAPQETRNAQSRRRRQPMPPIFRQVSPNSLGALIWGFGGSYGISAGTIREFH